MIIRQKENHDPPKKNLYLHKGMKSIGNGNQEKNRKTYRKSINPKSGSLNRKKKIGKALITLIREQKETYK